VSAVLIILPGYPVEINTENSAVIFPSGFDDLPLQTQVCAFIFVMINTGIITYPSAAVDE